MPVISAQRLALLGGLVNTLSDELLGNLNFALSQSKDKALAEVHKLISAEIGRRLVLSEVFFPFTRLFKPRNDGVAGLVFPRWFLPQLWAALSSRQAQLTELAARSAAERKPNTPVPPIYIRTVAEAAALIRNEPEAVLAANDDAAMRAQLMEFAECLDLNRLLCGLLNLMPECLSRIDPEKEAALKIIYKDASAISQTGGPCLFEVLMSHIDSCAMIMRFVATVSDGANDRFLDQSELASFGRRILDHCESEMKTVGRLMTEKLAPGQASNDPEAARRLQACLNVMQGFEKEVELTREGPWGRRMGGLYKSSSSLMEGRLQSLVRMVEAALPVRKLKGRAAPRFDRPADADTVSRTEAALRFARLMRPSANKGGYGTLLSRINSEVDVLLNDYLEDMLVALNSGDAPENSVARPVADAFLSLAAAHLSDDETQVARRRVASALGSRQTKSVA